MDSHAEFAATVAHIEERWFTSTDSGGPAAVDSVLLDVRHG